MRTVRRKKKGYPGLEIEENIQYQARHHEVQRVGWVAMAAFVAGAAGGLFGDGPISDTRSGGWDRRLVVHGERFLRFGRPDVLRIQVPPDGEPVRLEVDQRFLESTKIQRIVPEPDRSVPTPEGLAMEFRGVDRAEEVEIAIHFVPVVVGPLPVRVARESAPASEIAAFVYP